MCVCVCVYVLGVGVGSWAGRQLSIKYSVNSTLYRVVIPSVAFSLAQQVLQVNKAFIYHLDT